MYSIYNSYTICFYFLLEVLLLSFYCKTKEADYDLPMYKNCSCSVPGLLGDGDTLSSGAAIADSWSVHSNLQAFNYSELF